MKEYEKYGLLDMDITLMKNGYDMEDMDNLFIDPFMTLYSTRIGFMWQPSAVGQDAITIELIFKFILTGAATTLVSKITADLYTWTKTALSKVFNKKNSFDESKIILKFDDITVTIYSNDKKELIDVMSHLNIIIPYLQEKGITENTCSIDTAELEVLRKDFKD